MIYFLIIASIIVYFIYKTKPVGNTNIWRKSFSFFQFSTQIFYDQVQKVVMNHEYEGIKFSRVSYFMSGILSAKREYLRIEYKDFFFDVCAVPYGKDFYISCWAGETNKDMLARIPLLNTILGKNREVKTYYQLDTDAMFRSCIQACVMEVIDDITATQGKRGLTESDHQAILN